MRSLLCFLLVTAAGARTLVVAPAGGDYNGLTDAPIRAALAAAQSGDVVAIRPGLYTIEKTLVLDRAVGVTIRGETGTVLQLPRLPWTELEPAEAGAEAVVMRRPARFAAGDVLRLNAPGAPYTHNNKSYATPTFDVVVAAVDGARLVLRKPLPYPVPAGTAIAGTNNLIEMRSGRDLTLENLVLDGHREPDDPTFVGHVALCTFLAHGPYSYDKGLVGEPIRGLRFRNCVFRRVHGRPIAWYAVADSEITGCTAEDSPDAGIDVDHFCTSLRVSGNTIRRCGIGIEVNDGSRCSFEDNRIEDCGQGLVIWRWCNLPGLNEANLVRNNRIVRTRGPAIRLDPGAHGNRIVGNHLEEGQGSGLVIQGPDNLLADNVVRGFARHGIQVTAAGNELRNNAVSDVGREDPARYSAVVVPAD